MAENLLTRRGRMTVTIEPGDTGKVVLQCPSLKRKSAGVLLPTSEGTRFILSEECRLYTFDWSWADFFDSGNLRPHQGNCGELVNLPLAKLDARLPDWSARLDVLFGLGAGAAAEILAKDSRLGFRDLHVAVHGADPATKRNRAQAIVLFPLLRDDIALRDQDHHVRGREFTRLVDEGAALLRELPKLFGCKPWVIRHLRGLSVDDISPYHSTAVGVLIENMEWLTPERAPTEPGQYYLLSFLSDRRFHPTEPYAWIVPAIRRSILKSGWPEFGTRVERIDAVFDYGRFVERLAIGLTEYTDDLREAIDAALGRPTFRQVVALAARWHVIEDEIRTNLSSRLGGRPEGTWRPLFEEDFEIDGYRLRCLRTRRELMDEGMTLNHCVASYSDRCEAGQSHIVRITHDAKPVATAEVHLRGKRGAVRQVAIQQISAHRNAPAPVGAVNAVEALVKRLGREDLSDFPEPSAIKVRRDNAVTWLFERILKLEGLAGLERYRACLQPNAAHTKLWEHVVTRCRAGRLEKRDELTRFDGEVLAPILSGARP